jgi:polygalacturonase
VIGNFDRTADLLALVFVLGSICIPFEALARSGAPAGCTNTPASRLTINVRDKGAKGDGRTDDAAAIQRAIDEVGSKGGTVFVPDGTYMVDGIGPKRLTLKSRMTLKLSPGATLKTIPNGETHSAILTISGVSDVTVTGGTLVGDRDQHQGTTGEWGHGIRIERGAQRITVSDVSIKDMWGDGVFVEAVKDVALCRIIADHNRRQGLSVIEADALLVTNSVFKNTRGTRPSAGIDLEPDRATQKISNVRIAYSKFLDNLGPGVLISGQKGAQNISNVEITSNFFRNTTPVKIKYAPGVLDSAICQNRYLVRLEPSSDLATVASRSEEVIVMAGCGDPGLRTRQ